MKKTLIIPIIILLSLTGCNNQEGNKPSPTTPPILQIDTSGHKSLIRNIIFTSDGRYLVSAGDDKLVRVWDIKTANTVRTLRGQIDAGDEGKILAMALSPDGQWLAVGGIMATFTGFNTEEVGVIRLYNFLTGKLVTLLKGHQNKVVSLAFSPNSRYLISGQGGSFDQVAIIWDINKQQRLHTLKGHTKEIYAVAFTPDSKRVVTGSYDHSLRLWRVANGELISKLQGHTDKVQSVAISPQDGTITTGSWDHSIRLWDGVTGKFIKTLANQETRVANLSFSPKGDYLISGTSGAGEDYCHVWSYPSGKEILTYKEHDNIVLASSVSPDGDWVATGGGNEIHIWNLREGTIKQRLRGVGASIWAVGFSPDGKQIAWGKTDGGSDKKSPLKYRLKLFNSNSPLEAPKEIKADQKNYLRAQNKWQEWSLHHRKGGDYGYNNAILEIRNENRPVANIERGTTTGYRHLSYSFTPNGETIISSGGNGIITSYQRDGTKIGNYIGHSGIVWAIAVSANGRFLLSGSDDQTVRLWNIETRENLLSLFHSNNGEWVAWTPSGHYAASPNGDKIIGWQINKGMKHAADYITGTKLSKSLKRPDIVANTVRLLSNKQALTQAGLTDFKLEGLIF